MIDREELAARVYVALYTRDTSARGMIAAPNAGELAAEAHAVAQTFASQSCQHFGHVYGGEGSMHEHECARCGGDLRTLLEADKAAHDATKKGTYFQPRRIYIGDCD